MEGATKISTESAESLDSETTTLNRSKVKVMQDISNSDTDMVAKDIKTRLSLLSGSEKSDKIQTNGVHQVNGTCEELSPLSPEDKRIELESKNVDTSHNNESGKASY